MYFFWHAYYVLVVCIAPFNPSEFFILFIFIFINIHAFICVGAQTGYFPQPGNSTLQSAQLQPHQTQSFNLQGNIFGTPSQSHTNTGMQNFNSHFLNTPIQMAAAAALNAQQFRSNLPAAYMKSVNSQINDQASRAQQLKSPSSQEMLSSVFNSGKDMKCEHCFFFHFYYSNIGMIQSSE